MLIKPTLRLPDIFILLVLETPADSAPGYTFSISSAAGPELSKTERIDKKLSE